MAYGKLSWPRPLPPRPLPGPRAHSEISRSIGESAPHRRRLRAAVNDTRGAEIGRGAALKLESQRTREALRSLPAQRHAASLRITVGFQSRRRRGQGRPGGEKYREHFERAEEPAYMKELGHQTSSKRAAVTACVEEGGDRPAARPPHRNDISMSRISNLARQFR